MSYKPSEFLIGISELISILLPGALASYLLLPSLMKIATLHGLPPLDGPAGWVAFVLLAYLLGHLIFLIGAWLDKPYDFLRQWLRPRETDATYLAATAVAGSMLRDVPAVLNTYKFATALLSLHHETAAAEVRQFEADSKFFRSLTVLIVLLAAWCGRYMNAGEITITLLLLIACFWRYMERRWKSTHRAFEYLMTIGALSASKNAA